MTDTEKQEIAQIVFEMIVGGNAENAIDYTSTDEAPTDPEEQARIIIPGIRRDEEGNEEARNYQLRQILIAFGADVEALSQQVKDAVDAIEDDKEEINITAETVSTQADSVADAYSDITDNIVPHIDEQKNAVDAGAQTAIEKATSATNSANSASGSASTAQNALSGVNAKLAEMQALYGQMLTLASQSATPTVLIEGQLYNEITTVRNGKIIKVYQLVEEETA